jgi:hypothetical protein
VKVGKNCLGIKWSTATGANPGFYFAKFFRDCS